MRDNTCNSLDGGCKGGGGGGAAISLDLGLYAGVFLSITKGCGQFIVAIHN